MNQPNTVDRPTVAPVDSLGCAFSRLAQSAQLSAGDLRFYRKRSDEAVFGQVQTPAAARGFLVGMSLQAGHRRKILRGKAATAHDFMAHGMYIRDFSDDYRAVLSGSFDFVLVEMPQTWLERFGAEQSRPTVRGLSCQTAHQDEILGHLLRAMLPAFERPFEASQLFVSQLGHAVGTHLVDKYGGAGEPSMRRRQLLSRWQESRAKEHLMASASADVSIEEIAAECQLSPSYFIRAFRQTTGQTPYQWQLLQRIVRARTLLETTALTLVDIASACGFTDQSHFTRVFSKGVGMAPGMWRKRGPSSASYDTGEHA